MKQRRVVLGGPAMVAPPVVVPIQIAANGNTKGKDEPLENVFVQPTRAVLRQLSNAQKLLAQDRYGEAVRYLGAILEGSEDYFFQPDRNKPRYRSLKAEAHRLIGRMPRRGRELYELQYGARARQMLSEAAGSADAGKLAEVSRRFFHTEAGYEATLLLGLHDFNCARPLAAALTLQRLHTTPDAADRFEPTLSLATATCWVQAGMPEKAAEVLLALKQWALKQRLPGGTVEIAGREVPLFDEQTEPVDWLLGWIGSQPPDIPAELRQWAMLRGNPSRTAVTAGSSPLMNMLWRVPSSDHPLAESILGNQVQLCRELSIPALPELHPLAVGDVVLMRTIRNLLAVDFRTGKRLWEVPVDDPLEKAMAAYQSVFRQPQQLALALWQRIWKDSIYGTISSDGELVFSVEDLGLGMYRSGQQWVIVNGRREENPAWPKPYNRLAAHDIRTGKLVWHVGGSAEQYGLPLAGAFFLGPPLPLMDRLYQLAEIQGEIRLLTLDAKTGAMLWSQQVALVERKILEEPLRRMVAVSPSYADGILVCPTSNGAVVAVELATRSLLWGYRYSQGKRPRGHQRGFIGFRPASPTRPGSTTSWTDGSAILADSRVLVAPAGSQELHCLDLIDGKLIWKSTRQNDLHVACTHKDKVVLVGRRQIRAIRLSDGKPAWSGRAVALPEGSVPSGRGCSAAGLYYQPLSSAQVLTLDLAAGKIKHVARSRSGNVPGNLIFHKGMVVSQGLDGLEVFHQLDALAKKVDKTLKQHPDDPQALAERGEILLEGGKRSEAVDCFRRSYKLAKDPRTRQLLRRTLLDGLYDEFAAYRTTAEEIEGLVDEPRHRAEYLRLMATGLEGAKEWTAALGQYWKLIELGQTYRGLEQLSDSASVRLDRWVQVRLAELRKSAPEAVAAEIDRSAQARFEAAVNSPEIDPLRLLVDHFGSHPIAEQARRELIGRLKKANRLLEAEMLLRRQARSTRPEVAAATLVELAKMLRQADRPRDAAACYRQLQRDLAETVATDGKTGRQLVDEIPKDDPVRKWIHPQRLWPVGLVKVEKTTRKNAQNVYYQKYPLKYRGSRAPFFSERTVFYDHGKQEVSVRDGFGREEWKVSLGEGNQRFLLYNRGLAHASVSGHLLLLSMTANYVALDMLGDGTPRVLWHRQLTQPIPNQFGYPGGPQVVMQGMQGMNMVVWNQQIVQVMGRAGRAVGPAAAITDDYFCYRRFRSCVAVDPLTGETLWVRRDSRSASNPDGGITPTAVFGSEQFVFVVPHDRTEATVLRAVDGTPLPDRRTVPPADQRIATLGRKVLVWRAHGNKRILEMSDPWQKRIAWGPHSFAANAKHTRLGNEVVGVMEPGGRFVLISLADGRKIVDAQLQPEPTLQEIVLLESADGYFLVTHGPPRNRRGQSPRQLRNVSSRLIHRGRVYGFDREGKRLWPDRPRGVLIEQQQLLTSQPGWLPVLTFASGSYERKNNRSRWYTSILLIDKRNGRVVAREKFENQVNNFQYAGDPEKKTVQFQLQRDVMTLTFTDEPLPPETETPEQAERQPGVTDMLPKTFKAMLDALKKASGG